jgi:ferritin
MAIISEAIIDLVNYRIEQEEYSSRIYLDIAVCMEYQGYMGAAELFKKYAEEEMIHAKKAYDYLLSLMIRPIIPALKEPKNDYKDLPEVIKLAYDHELEVTKQCSELAKAAAKEGDYMTLEFAQWYLREQVEEIDKTGTLMDELNTFGKSPEALRMLDTKMGKLAKHYKITQL